jgi:hypothetical protein
VNRVLRQSLILAALLVLVLLVHQQLRIQAADHIIFSPLVGEIPFVSPPVEEILPWPPPPGENLPCPSPPPGEHLPYPPPPPRES